MLALALTTTSIVCPNMAPSDETPNSTGQLLFIWTHSIAAKGEIFLRKRAYRAIRASALSPGLGEFHPSVVFIRFNPFRTPVPFWGQTNLELEWFVPTYRYGTAVLNGLTGSLFSSSCFEKPSTQAYWDSKDRVVFLYPVPISTRDSRVFRRSKSSAASHPKTTRSTAVQQLIRTARIRIHTKNTTE